LPSTRKTGARKIRRCCSRCATINDRMKTGDTIAWGQALMRCPAFRLYSSICATCQQCRLGEMGGQHWRIDGGAPEKARAPVGVLSAHSVTPRVS
jgi:hypothetical protein